MINIQKALEEMREQFPDDYLQEHMEYPVPYLFAKLTENNNRCELSKAVNAGGHTELIARRIATRSVPDPDDILVTIPQLSFCVHTADLSYTIDDTAEIWFKDDAECARFDYTEQNEVENRFEFYYDDDLVAWVR